MSLDLELRVLDRSVLGEIEGKYKLHTLVFLLD
jgi:hypothetical protein